MKINLINPIAQIEKSNAWTRSSFTDGKQISTAKSPIDWTVKALFDSMLAREKEVRRLGAYERRKVVG
jgi:hypothetical protein